MAFISVRGLTRRFASGKGTGSDVRALDGVDLEVERGEWLAVVGPSGSGKSTLLNVLGGLDRSSEGEVLVDGLDLVRAGTRALARYRREDVGLVFQQFHLVPYLTVLENVCLAQYFHSMACPEEARAALGRVGLAERLQHLPHQLSGGEQQRVCIARALINSPRLLLADEPTGNLDRENQLIVVELLRRLHREGHTLVMVTHDPELARAADRVVEIRHGKIRELPIGHPRSPEEFHDEVLEQLWTLPEEGTSTTATAIRLPEAADVPGILAQLARQGLIQSEGEVIALTERGKLEARELVRRHRLAETLLLQTLGVEDHLIEPNACRFEHVLTREVTESICTFLGHPERCPHGLAIPRGECCLEERRLVPGLATASIQGEC